MEVVHLFTVDIKMSQSGTESARMSLIPFDGTNYALWKKKASAYIKGAGWARVVFSEKPLLLVKQEEEEIKKPLLLVKPEEEEIKKEKELYGDKAYAFLINSLKDNVLGLFTDVQETAGALWEALKNHYQRDTTASKHATRYKLMNQQLGKDEDITLYISRIIQYGQELKGMSGETVTDADLLYALFNGLTSEYSALVSTLKVAKAVTFAEAVQHLKDHYEYLKLSRSRRPEVTEVNYAKDRSRHDGRRHHSGRGRSKPGRGDHFQGQGTGNFVANGPTGGNHRPWSNSGQESRGQKWCKGCNKSGHNLGECRNRECYNCGKRGHLAKDCRSGRSGDSGKHGSTGANWQNHSRSESSSHYTAVSYDECLYVGDGETGSFIVDSGATSHYVNSVDLLDGVVPSPSPMCVVTANDSKVPIEKLGSSRLHGSKTVELQSVKYVPSFKHNLLSVAKLTNNGATVTFGKSAVVVELDGQTIITGTRKGDLYYMQALEPKGCETAALADPGKLQQVQRDKMQLVPQQVTQASKLHLYHQRCGHLSLSGIKDLVNSGAVLGVDYLKGIRVEKEHMCDACQAGKSHRQPFSDHSLRVEAKEVLDRIYCDLSGRITLTSLSPTEERIFIVLGSPEYLSIIVDEKSRYISGTLLTFKSQAADHVITWIRQAQTEKGRPVKYFHSDNGTEYYNNKLLTFFGTIGVKTEATVPYTPQHNAIAERANRVIFNMVRSMLQHAKLPAVFWGEAAKTALYLMNLRLTSHNRLQTPHEVFYGQKPYVHHLRVFGCDAYAHINTQVTKLEARSIKGIFIGYDDRRENNYRIYDLENHRVLTSRDVVFYENSFTFGRGGALAAGGGDLDVLKELLFAGRIPGNAVNYQLAVAVPRGSATVSDSIVSTELPAGLPATAVNTTPSFLPASVRQPVDQPLAGQSPSVPLGQSETHGADRSSAYGNLVSTLRQLRLSAYSLPKGPAKQSRLQSIDQATKALHDASQQATDEAKQAAQADVQRIVMGLTESNPSASVAVSHEPRVCVSAHEHAMLAAAAVLDEGEPKSYDEAITCEDSHHWMGAIGEEVKSLTENNTFILVKRSTLPPGTNIMDCRWVFKIKRGSDGSIERYKARLVAKGFTQKEGIDYNETFAPVVKYKSLRVMLALATMLNYNLHQMDVITAFLNGELKEDVYMRVPQGFFGGDLDGPSGEWVVKLLRSLYGTKQAPHVWNEAVNQFIISLGFKRLSSDTCVYVRATATSHLIILSIFVDDIVSAYHDDDEQEWSVVKRLFMAKYNIKDIGELKWVLGMRVTRDRAKATLVLDQHQYLTKVVNKFNMQDSKPCGTPETPGSKLTQDQCPKDGSPQQVEMKAVPYEAVVGSLLYASLGTRPDIAHAVNEISKYMKNPGPAHWTAAKRILRYVNGTLGKGLVFSGGMCDGTLHVDAYSDADWAGDVDDRKSTSGYVVKLGNNVVSWATKKQKTVSLSSAEAEYMAIATASQEISWIKQLLSELLTTTGIRSEATLSVDNQAALLISKNDLYHDRTKHIDIRYHFVRDHIKAGLLTVKWVSTHDQLADVFTKALPLVPFARLCSAIMGSQ